MTNQPSKRKVIFLDSKRKLGGPGEIIQFLTEKYNNCEIKAVAIVMLSNNEERDILWGASGFDSFVEQVGALEYLQHRIMAQEENFE